MQALTTVGMSSCARLGEPFFLAIHARTHSIQWRLSLTFAALSTDAVAREAAASTLFSKERVASSTADVTVLLCSAPMSGIEMQPAGVCWFLWRAPMG